MKIVCSIDVSGLYFVFILNIDILTKCSHYVHECACMCQFILEWGVWPWWVFWLEALVEGDQASMDKVVKGESIERFSSHLWWLKSLFIKMCIQSFHNHWWRNNLGIRNSLSCILILFCSLISCSRTLWNDLCRDQRSSYHKSDHRLRVKHLQNYPVFFWFSYWTWPFT